MILNSGEVPVLPNAAGDPVEDVAVSWFGLKNGDFIGIRQGCILYGSTEGTDELIDGLKRVASVIRPADYQDGIAIRFNERFPRVQIRNSIHRFSTVDTAMAFINGLQKEFPYGKLSEERESFARVARGPLAALVFLTLGLIGGLVSEPGSGSGRFSALFAVLSAIPSPALLTGYIVLSGVALGNAFRLWKRAASNQVLVLR